MSDFTVTTPAETVWFITCVANPCGFKSRYNLYDAFAKHITETVQAQLMTVECAFDDLPWVLQSDHPNNHIVRVRSGSRLWTKESLLNIAVKHLPEEATLVCWCDADIEFLQGSSIKTDIINALQEFDVVQCFSTALDLGPDGSVMKIHHGFGWNEVCGISSLKMRPTEYETYNHSGYVWATTRRKIERWNGFIDIGICGAGDRLMAMSFLGKVQDLAEHDYSDDYKRCVRDWQSRVETTMTKGVGYCPGVIRHNFHGYKKDRGYNSRSEILRKHKFSPCADTIKNADGVIEFAGNKPDLEGDVLKYFVSRKEDAA